MTNSLYDPALITAVNLVIAVAFYALPVVVHDPLGTVIAKDLSWTDTSFTEVMVAAKELVEANVIFWAPTVTLPFDTT